MSDKIVGGGAHGTQFFKNIMHDAMNKDKTTSLWTADMRKTRLKAWKEYGIMTVSLCVLVFTLLCIYWGCLDHIYENLPSLKILVVDMDGQVAPYNNNGITPVLGPLVQRICEERNGLDPRKDPHLGYVLQDASMYDGDVKAVWNHVYNQHGWGAIIINANATTLVTEALRNGNASYDPTGAIQMVYIEARDESSIDTYIVPELTLVLDMVVSKFGEMWTQQNLPLLNTSAALRAASRAPQALSPAVGYNAYNLRPFTPPIATASVTVGLIYLIISSFFAFSFFMPIHSLFMVPTPDHKPMNFVKWVLLRLIVNFTLYFFLSLTFSLVSLSFGIPFDKPPLPSTETGNGNAYNRGSFPVYWMLNFVGVGALGLPSENMGMLLGNPWAGMWLIFWVISNVAVSFYEIHLAPGFYTYGYAFPLHNVVEATRTILFDTHSKIGLNFGVLFAWIGVSIALFPFCAAFAFWKQKRHIRNEQEEAAKEHRDKDGNNLAIQESDDKEDEGHGLDYQR